MIDQNAQTPVQGEAKFARSPDRHDVPKSPGHERIQKWLLRYHMEHLHGPEEIAYEKDELVVLCLLRNGRPYIRSFIEHYFSLGVKHIVFLDNGSTDGTVEALCEYDNVTVLRTTLPYKRYQVLFKRYLIERFGQDRWSLYVDVDELFDYPYSDAVSLQALLRYLNERSYTAVVCYMVDMFSDQPLTDTEMTEDVPLKEIHRFYDTSNVRAYPYDEIGDVGNELGNEEIAILQGGIQKTVFNFDPVLMKHPLIFLDSKIKPMDLSDHWAGNARIADLTGVLFHYKLLGNLYGLVRREIEERRYPNRHGKYDKYFKVMDESSSLVIKDESSRELKSVNDLVGTLFAVVSKDYMGLVRSEEQRNGDYSQDDELDRMFEMFLRARAETRIHNQRIGEIQNLANEQASNLRQRANKLRRWANDLRQRAADRQERINNLRERANDLQRLAKQRHQRIETLERKTRTLERKRQTLQTHLERRIRNLEAYAQSLENQLQAIQSSRTWKLLTVFSQIKAKIAGNAKV